MNHWKLIALTCVSALSIASGVSAEEPVFSGPQVGEQLPGLTVKGVLGKYAGQEFDLIQKADGKPVLVIFVHARTRPAFGLANAVLRYAATRNKDGLASGAVFLTDDATETERWMKQVEQNLPKGVELGISPNGQEGPGAYGLNRHVALTVLVGKEHKIVANFALVQPGLAVDGPKILKAIVDVLGSGEVPDINALAGGRDVAMARPGTPAENDPNLRPLLVAVINLQAAPEDVEKAADKVEEYVEKNAAAARQLGRIANTVVSSGKLTDYGTPAAQTYLKKWAKKYPLPVPSQDQPPSKTDSEPTPSQPSTSEQK